MKHTMVNMISMFTLMVLFTVQLQSIKINAESTDDMNFEKKAYHFFRLKKSDRCLRIPYSIKQMILREPSIVCPEDREFLGL
ncbi:unnamed protein product [Schistosoma rodhaini]|uniref:Secreted protein n=1 Tax=Schistosoma mansoni TaxID=6183 RepID=G4VKA4_SCHMA|nr:hypothetical protein Smp_043650 [Schistosoma mansoni]CAH8611443.1 unnamed protein product [Schistosoma rodhaini]|eukprot:XP_018652713.1 hypothetical protein Smp_043650 [Schistosoma mansoni]